MNSNFLRNIDFSIYGESHGQSIGVIIDNIGSGLEIDFEMVNQKLKERKPKTKYNTKRNDQDQVYVESGIKDNKTTGTPLVLCLKNDDVKSSDYKSKTFRLNHADYTSFLKFGENYPYAGGGPFSGRITAIIVVVGEIFRQLLIAKQTDMKIYGQIKQVLTIKAPSLSNYSLNELDFFKEKSKSKEQLPTIDQASRIEIEQQLEQVINNNDSLGAEIELLIKNVPQALGGIYFDSLESIISHAIFSIPGVKGINFGAQADHYLKTGTELLEEIEIIDQKIIAKTNFSGGINGGISNGYQDLIFTCIVKAPTPLNHKQNLLQINQEDKLQTIGQNFFGRHDRLIANKVLDVIEAWLQIVISDFILENKKGEIWK